MFDIGALQSELKTIFHGEVLADEASLEHYAKDGSIFRVKPWAVVQPKDVTDIIALARWMHDKRGKDSGNVRLSITARGKATDQAGGPINEGIIIRFPGSLDKILEIGPDFVRVEPGAIFGLVNQELEKQARFIPPYPASHMFSTIGGAVANNGSGEKSTKYGPTRVYVKSLKMVLSTGTEVIVMPLKYGDLELKKQQLNLEGDIYRNVEALLKKEKRLIERTRPKVAKYASGYNVWDIERKTPEGKVFDLTQLIAGSQGTLGILTEVSLWTLPKPQYAGLLIAFFDSLPKAGDATKQLLALGPSALEMVDHFLLKIAKEEKPEMLEGLLPSVMPQIVLLCEFDSNDLDEIKKKLDQAQKSISKIAYASKLSLDPQEQAKLWQVRRSAALVAESARGKKKALPFIEDVVVPREKFPEYVAKLYEIMQREQLEFSVWGHAGQGNIHIQPFLDIADPNDRARLFKVSEEVYNIVASLGGVLSGEHNDGLMRTPYLAKIYPPELIKVWQEVKKVFDPLNIFNPGKKVGVDLNYLQSHLREEYEVGPLPKAGEKAVT